MLGELNWVFTAITDTIAWNILPRGMLLNINICIHWGFYTINEFVLKILSKHYFGKIY